MMRRLKTSRQLIGISIFLLFCGILEAQEGFPDLSDYRGRSFRLTLRRETGSARLLGRLLEVGPDALELASGGHRRSVPIESVDKVELLPRGRWGRMLLVSVGWGLAGGLFFKKDSSDWTRLARAGEGALVGGLVGAMWDRSKQEPAEVLFERPAEPGE